MSPGLDSADAADGRGDAHAETPDLRAAAKQARSTRIRATVWS